MRRTVTIAVLFAGLALSAVLLGPRRGQADQHDSDESESRIARGFEIAPVPLNLEEKNRALVGLGSYIVNAQGNCNNCHTCPSSVGHSITDNPFVSGGTLSQIESPGVVNPANYLAGGVHFGPVIVSANITPDPLQGNRPEGLTFEEFQAVIQTGHDPDKPGHILQVMPWPNYRHMTEHDLRAIYEYLSAIPPAKPGTCAGPDSFQVRP